MKKLILVTAIGALFTSCSIFVRTPHHAAGATIGSTEKVKPVHAEKAVVRM